MQVSVPQAPHGLKTTLAVLAAILSGIGIDRLYNSWLNRKKPASEIHLTDASAEESTVRAYSQAGDAMGRMMDRLDTAQLTIDRLRKERDEWEMKAFDLQVELRDSRTANGLLTAQAKLDNYHIRKQAAFIEAKGLKSQYSALDAPPCDE